MWLLLTTPSVCIASIVVVAYSITYDTSSPEVSWNVAPIMIWASVEVNLAIVSGKNRSDIKM